MHHLIKDTFAGLVDVVYPPRCPACGKPRGNGSSPGPHGLCTICDITVMRCESPMCPACGLPYTGAAGPDHSCGDCGTRPPPFVARAAFLYGGAIHDLIASFKYAGRLHAGETLTRMALATGVLAPLAGDCTIAAPVPLHFTRLMRRGYNQSAVIARMAARASGLAYEPAALRRVKRTPPQAALSRKEREVNLNGAFTVPRPGGVRGKGVLLIDDVFTTGATAAACARALLDAGASKVNVFTLARTA